MMLDTLRKIGIPTAIATSISLVVVVVPLLFQVDERYAKQATLEAEVKRLEKQNRRLEERNNQLTAELAQNAGFQQAMIGFIAQGRIPTAPIRLPLPAPTPSVDVEQLPSTNAGVEQPAATAVAPPAPAIERLQMEPPRNWRELNDAVSRQQQRLMIER